MRGRGGSAGRYAVAALAIVRLSFFAPAPAESGEESVAAYYNRVIATMNALPVPDAIVFRTNISATGVGLRLADENGEARLLVGIGSSFQHAASWQTRVAAGTKTDITTGDNRDLDAASPIFNPTWNGAFSWLKYGLNGPPLAPTTGTPRPDPIAAKSRDDTTAPHEIGRIQAISTAYYRVDDAGTSICPSGTAGRHLHLTPWRNAESHPVTDVDVDSASNRICSLRFNLGTASALSLTGSYDLRFAQVDGYWLVAAAEAHLLYRMFGIGAKHATLLVTYDRTTLN